MGSEQTNVARLREVYARWAKSRGASVEEWCELCDEGISLVPLADGAPGLELTVPARGKEGLRAYLAGVASDRDMLSFEVAEYVARGERVVAIVDSA
jgi:uncharacterized protein